MTDVEVCPERAEELLDLHKEKIQRKTAFAGGIWTWSRIFPSYSKTFDTARGQLEACKKLGVETGFENELYCFELIKVFRQYF